MKVMLGAVHKSARETVRKIRALGNSGLERQARELAGLVKPSRLRIDDANGYVKFNADDVGLGAAVSKLSQLTGGWKFDPARGGRSKGGDKEFIRYLLRPNDLIDIPDVMDIVFNAELYGAITQYLGQVPWLVTLKLWWTLPNQTAVRSQLYHYDHRDTRQAKVFINLNDVGEDSGPLHFLPAVSSLEVDRRIGYSQGDYSDAQVYSCCPVDKVIKTTGPQGAGYIVDTARCLHYGSRGNVRERLVLMICYSRVNCVDKGSGCDVLDPMRERLISQRYAKDRDKIFSLRQA